MTAERSVEPQLGQQCTQILRADTDELRDFPLLEGQVVSADTGTVTGRDQGAQELLQSLASWANLPAKLLQRDTNLASQHAVNPPGERAVLGEQASKLRGGELRNAAWNRADRGGHPWVTGDRIRNPEQPAIGTKADDPLTLPIGVSPGEFDEPLLDEEDGVR